MKLSNGVVIRTMLIALLAIMAIGAYFVNRSSDSGADEETHKAVPKEKH